METRANHFVIGTFILLFMASGFGFLYWIKNFGTGSAAKEYAVLFQGPVDGIIPGSLVLFNGVRVGRVRSLHIDAVDTTRVRVNLEVARGTPVRMNSRARISQQGLTGTGVIQLTSGTLDSAVMPGSTRRHMALIVPDQGGAGSLMESAPKVLGNADIALNRINGILLANAGPISRTISNIEAVSNVLAENRGDISGLISDIRGLSRKFERIEPLLVSAQALILRLDGVVDSNEARIARTLGSVETFTSELAANKGEFTTIVGNVRKVTSDLAGTGKVLNDAGRVVARVEKLVDSNADRITAAVGNIEAFTAALERNKGQVDLVFNDVRALTRQLRLAAVKMERTLDKVGGFLESEDGTSIVTEARAAITSFRKLAGQLEGSVGANADKLTRSTRRNLAELELFMRDGRRLVRNLDQVLSGLDRNPQRLLFGGSPVPEYNPQ